MIQLEQLTKRYGATVAVDHLDLEVAEGELCVLVGPSGCGKTTTMKMINRLVEPTSGRILLEGRDVTHGDPVELRRRIGYVIQQVGLFPHLTIADNVATVPKLLGWDKKKVRARVDRAARPRRASRRSRSPSATPTSSPAASASASAWRVPSVPTRRCC